MSNLNTVAAVTENILSVLKGEGINFSCKTFDPNEAIAASTLPFGELFYEGEEFEHKDAGHPGYVEARYKVRLVLSARDPLETIREEQKWVHSLRAALTVDALNIGGLTESKLVSKVTAIKVDIDNRERFSTLICAVTVRYRES